MKLEIRRPERDPQFFDVEPGTYTIGSDSDCSLRLAHDEVEDRHAILTLREGAHWVEDLASSSGTRIDGTPIDGRHDLKAGEQIGVGPFVIILQEPARPVSAPSPAAARPVAPTPVPAPTPPAPVPAPAPAAPPPPTPTPAAPAGALDLRRQIKQQIHTELVERLDIKRLTASRIDRAELEDRASTTLKAIVREVRHKLPPGITPEEVIKEVYDEALGLGPLERFLSDPEVTEIMVNGADRVYVEKRGKIVLTDQTFMDETSVLAVIERIVSPIGRRIDESQPYVDARLPDGSRVNAIIAPLSLIGPCLTIRKFSEIPFTDEDLINFGTFTPEIAKFVSICVKMRKNIVVSGGTGSGKTSLLNVLSGYLPETERILTIEDAAELRLGQAHVIRLEARPPNIEGRGAILIRDLVRNALRMRPDRIVVGECRGGEALDMLQAMNTGHDGSLTTVHANSPRDVISRLETMVLMSGMDLPVRAIREQIAAAVDLIVHESRFSDGTRKVTKVTEIVGLEGEQVTMQDIFEYRQTGVDADGGVVGQFAPTGAVPTFLEDIGARGMSIDHAMFDPNASTRQT